MRILPSKESKHFLLEELKKKHGVNSMRSLSLKLGVSKNFLDKLFYIEKRYLPDFLIPSRILDKLDIIDKQEDNWGRVKGGKEAYKKLINKYGISGMRNRQINGGSAAMRNPNNSFNKPFVIDINDSRFLEIYGILLGDGWLSNLNYRGKDIWLVGISGDKRLDKEFYFYLKKNILNLFQRRAYIKIRKNNNSMEINFGHKMLIKALNEELNFPIGVKNNLEIDKKIMVLSYEKLKYVIRGIFDTDGSFYLDKTSSGNPYPVISIEMKERKLIKQLYGILLNHGFKVSHRLGHDKKEGSDRITLKGRIQLEKWMKEIGSSNLRHLNKINALVTQPG